MDNFKIVISSHIKSYQTIAPLFIESLIRGGLSTEKILLVVGGNDSKNKTSFLDCETIFVDHNSYDHAGLIEVLEGKHADLVEGYSHLNKNHLKQCVKFCETVINDCNSYRQLKKVERKPRAKKAVSPERMSSKFKYLKEFDELGLKSESPAKLIGSSEAWLYDTAKRKLIHVMADSHIGTFTVKGSAIVGFDALATVQKTLRKPVEQIKLVMGSKPVARKEFEAIKSTETKFTGRGNVNLIILKAW